MGQAIKQSIDEGYECFEEYSEKDILSVGQEKFAFISGWKEGYEWILSDLYINKEISGEILKKYMDKLKIANELI